MAGQLPSLGELEILVLRVIWDAQPCSERAVWEQVRRQRKVGRTTVLKTIQRLEAKGLLERVAGKRGPVQFLAAVPRRRLLPTLVRRFVDGTLGGSLEPLVSYLADSDRLSGKDLAALRAIARKMAADDKT